MGDAAASVPVRLADQLEAIIANRIAKDQLVLPALPATAVKVLGLLRNDELPLNQAARLIEADPILTAQILKLVNSAAVGGRDPIKSVLQAVTRLGLQKLRSFLVEASARKAFDSVDPRIAEAAAGLWTHSVAVALLARDVVAFTASGDPEYGYLGGLLHDIGKPVVAAMLLDAERAVRSQKAHAVWISGPEWIGVVQRCHRRLGVALTEKWQMPDVVSWSVRDCEEYDNNDRTSVTNAVRFANALAKQAGFYVGEVAKDDNDALVMIGRSLLNIDEALVKKLVDNLPKAVKEQQG